MAKQMFLNIPVKNLTASIDFFTKVGFSFNPEFTDENATCMIIGENIFSMLLTEKFFQTFTKKEISDTSKTIEGIIGIAVESREEVDNIVQKAIGAGGKETRDAYDYGWMYGRTFEDLDGHTWEFFFMDESKAPKK